ncbi:MAG: hypothetical protein INH41_18280 [Myxococcaceae bacterium]|jgi:hypothetical protein|nr:hypothetical protein [Myxococcaceae bacterium]MCA3014335.1 hypothetical protein [Myxococcaceae bacterium]
MKHPSIYELACFAETGHGADEFEPHVQVCDDCARRLSQLAWRSLAARGLTADVVVPAAPAPVVVPLLVAVLTCFAMMVSSQTSAAPLPPSGEPVSVGPSELHGTPLAPSTREPARRLTPGDAGWGSRSD